jgi:hypothetical protein
MRVRFALTNFSTTAPTAPGILDHVTKRVGPKLGVKRNRHYTGPHRAEHGLHELDTVADRHRQAIVGLDAEPRQS